MAEQIEIIAEALCEGKSPLVAERLLKALEAQLDRQELRPADDLGFHLDQSSREPIATYLPYAGMDPPELDADRLVHVGGRAGVRPRPSSRRVRLPHLAGPFLDYDVL